MSKILKSTDTAFLNLLLDKYPFILLFLLFIASFALYAELKDSLLMMILLACFCFLMVWRWYKNKKSDNVQYCHEARQVYIKDNCFLYVGDKAKLFHKTKFLAVSIKQIDTIEYLDYMVCRFVILYFYRITLKQPISGIGMSILFCESIRSPVFGIVYPKHDWQCPLAKEIKHSIEPSTEI